MKIQFKRQQFQEDAALSVVRLFNGQPRQTSTSLLEGLAAAGSTLPGLDTAWNNQPLLLDNAAILKNMRQVQIENGIQPSMELLPSPAARLNFSIEMETGTGKTYAYIKTLYELRKAYGWSKFIVVVPLVAIREGVFKSFEMTMEHFTLEYGERIGFFIYNSSTPAQIRDFAQDPGMKVMIINRQAFSSSKKGALKIDSEQDGFGSLVPMQVIANTRPIVIIDEPQSVEGEVTRMKLGDFNPLFCLRYSATHKKKEIYNLVYKLDAQDAYNMNLVKKISVKGFRQSHFGGTSGYIYLEDVKVDKGQPPTAILEFDCGRKSGKIDRIERGLGEGADLYKLSNKLREYRDNFIITRIDGWEKRVEFANGLVMTAGDVAGDEDTEQLRRLQIRETIKEHITREAANFDRGIKTLSLFFIDEVAKYRLYDKDGQPRKGLYAQMFEEEYAALTGDKLDELELPAAYKDWLGRQTATDCHAGYFSVDRKSRKAIDSVGKISEDADAYNLIMRDKERLLDPEEPVRFIFSHSALREGWDNPNVFQICALRQTKSETRKHQEVGRGMRLCVNRNGERMDSERLGAEVSDVNQLTVIASESYEDYTRSLQSDIAKTIDRPMEIDRGLFEDQTIRNEQCDMRKIDQKFATILYESLIRNDYISGGQFTEKYHEARKNGDLELPEAARPFRDDILRILDSVFNPEKFRPINRRASNVTLKVDTKKLASRAFKELWNRINAKSAYTVTFEEEELVKRAIKALNDRLQVKQFFLTMQTGTLESIKSAADLAAGTAFKKLDNATENLTARKVNLKYDLLGSLVEKTGLTRAAIAKILGGISKEKFAQFQENPEDFIAQTGRIIKAELATVIIEHISYNKLDSSYDVSIFTAPHIRGQVGHNAMAASRHLYDYVIYDSKGELEFAKNLDGSSQVELFVKLPKTFAIPTPVGDYHPDWAIAFKKGSVKHIYFVAETKGSLDTMELRLIEESRIKCAKEHFKAISGSDIQYDVVQSFQDLLDRVK